MIARDWVRLGLNLLLGPPIAYVIALAAVLLFLVGTGSNEPAGNLLAFMLVIGVPGAIASYVFGLLPALINGIVTGVLAHVLNRRRWRLWAALPAGAFSTWLGAGWMVAQSGQDYLAWLLGLAVPLGGAGASWVCMALAERVGARNDATAEAA